MDGNTIVQDVLAYMANEGIELSDDLGQAEMVVREQVLKIGASALERHLSGRKLGYEGSSRVCGCGGRQRFVEYRPKTMATLLGTVTIHRAYYRCGGCGLSCLPYDDRVGLGRGQVSVGLAKSACLLGEDVPDFRTISDFRKLHLPELQGLFVEVLKLCAAAGLVKVSLVSLDGAKVKANASRYKAMSYEYMQKEEERLHQEIAELLAKAKSADEAEDASHGSDKRGDELPEELSRRESRLARIQEAKKALETRALEAARAEEARRDAKHEQRRQAGETPRKRKPVDKAPKPKAQYNFTDPESKIMKVRSRARIK